jgi:ABC-type multidrug transport system fused ATPase/permease subunit
MIKQLWWHFTPWRRTQFWLLLVLMVLASFAEVFTVGATLPFLAILADPNKVFNHPSAEFLIQIGGFNAPEQLVLPITAGFCMIALVTGSLRVFLTWASIRFAFSAGVDLSVSIYRLTLYQPYAVHIARNSSEVISGVLTKASGVIYSVIMPVLSLMSSSLILVAILAALIAVDPVISLLAFAGFGLVFGFMVWITRSRKLKNSARIAVETTNVLRALQEGLGGIRDVLINGSQEMYCRTYQLSDRPMRLAQADNQFIAFGPRYGVEALGIVLIATLAYSMTKRPEGIIGAIPILGALAVGAQRMFPSMQLAYASWSNIESGRASLGDTLDFLGQPMPKCAEYEHASPMEFYDQISLKGISFKYAGAENYAFRGLNLTIKKGARVGLIGSTGCGKSTLLDVIMGLLLPNEGGVYVDGKCIDHSNFRAWQKRIAHVPQSIFLADCSVSENIAFGIASENIDHERVVAAARLAHVDDVIEALPNKYRSTLGERGVKLSGGQRQRIGIARALYKEPDVIIFDEATSALDTITEKKVMASIEGISKEVTIVIVAHRVETLRGCSEIFTLSQQGIISSKITNC